jgi:putative hydrolase of the HAD superfamily
VDDSLSVLKSARAYGFQWLLAVLKPDSRKPQKEAGGFDAIRDFSEIIPGF